MSNILVERESLQNIADSIRAKNGEETTYKPSEMSSAIDALPEGGGGFPPKDVSNIMILKASNGVISLTWDDPDDIILDDMIISAWKGTRVVYKTGNYPVSPNDGVVAVNSEVRNQYSENGFEITGLTNDTTYYIQLFPYSDKNVFNENESNRISSMVKSAKIYGIRRAIENSSPEWERLDDSIGLVANATHDGTSVQNDFDNLYPWSEIISCNYNESSGIINAYYGDDNFTFSGSNGNVYTIIPEFWYKRFQENGYEYQYISDTEIDGFIKSDEFMVGRYLISGSKSAVYSKNNTTPFTGNSKTNFRAYANALGSKIGIIDWRYFILQMLYLVEYATYDSQNSLGYGLSTSDGDPSLISGGCDILGMKSGCVENDGGHSVIYRGVEDIFGNRYQMIDGIITLSRYPRVCYDYNYYNQEYTTAYVQLNYTLSGAGYSSKIGCDPSHPLIQMPIESEGSDSTYTCDYFQAGSTSRNLVVAGGSTLNGSLKQGGLFWYNDTFSYNSSIYFATTRLMKY